MHQYGPSRLYDRGRAIQGFLTLRRSGTAITTGVVAVIFGLSVGQAPAFGGVISRSVAEHSCLRRGGRPWLVEGVILDLRHISVPRACTITRRFVSWVEADPRRRLATCTGPKNDPRSVLRIHTFDGWTLTEPGRNGGLTLSRGRSSFEMGGYDGWPTGCEPS